MTGLKRVILTVGILCLVSFITNTALSQLPWAKYSYFSNIGGLNDSQSTTEIADNEATDLANVVFDVNNAIKKRFGYTTTPYGPVRKVATGTDVSVIGLAFYEQADGDRYLVSVSNNDAAATVSYLVYDVGGGAYATGDYWTWVDDDVDILPTSGLSDNDHIDWTVAQDDLVFTIPSTSPDKPFKWDATGNVLTLTNDPDCPTCDIVEYHKNHLVVAGNTTNPSRVYFSNLDDIETWTATDFFDVDTNDGSQVRGLLSAFGALYIFKDYSIWRLSGYERDTFTLEKTVTGIGTKSAQSIAVVNNLIYFVTAQNDIMAYDGAYTVTPISQKVRNTLSGLDFTRSQYALGLAYSTYRYGDTDYYAAVSRAGVSKNDTVLVFDTYLKAWTKFNDFEPNAWCVADGSSGDKKLYFGDLNGYVYAYPSTSYYNGEVLTGAVNSFYQTKWFRYPEVSLGDKYWRVLRTYALTESAGGNLYADCKSDYEATGKILTISLASTGARWDVAVWDVDVWGGQNMIIKRDEIEKGKQMFQIKWSNSATEGFTLLGWEKLIEPTQRD